MVLGLLGATPSPGFFGKSEATEACEGEGRAETGCVEAKPLRLKVFFPSVEAVVALGAWRAGADFLPARGRRPPARALAICSRSPGSARPGRLRGCRGGRCRAPPAGGRASPRPSAGQRQPPAAAEPGSGRRAGCAALRCPARGAPLRPALPRRRLPAPEQRALPQNARPVAAARHFRKPQHQ